MKDYLNRYIDYIEGDLSSSKERAFFFYGPIRFRFLDTIFYDCLKDYNSYSLVMLIEDSNICKHLTFTDEAINSTSHMNFLNISDIYYPFKFSNQTNITHILNSPLGQVTTSGIVIDLYVDQEQDYNSKINQLKFLASYQDYDLLENYVGMELSYTLYDPNLDVFINNLLFTQRDIDYKPMITFADAIPFTTNIYEGSAGKSLESVDIIRIILIFILLIAPPFRMIQKYIKSEKKGCWHLMKLVVVVLCQLKNIILLFALGFILSAFISFSTKKIDTLNYYTANYFIDLYDFASIQKEKRALDILSMYLVGIYCLKFLQYIEGIHILYISFKKAAFEYFALLATICVLFIGLSILTNFVFGSYIYEYKNFIDSLTMNIRIFIFIENTSVTNKFLEYYKVFSIFVLIIFIFLIKYYLLNLFYPILMEYYRNEIDQHVLSKIYIKSEGEDPEMKFKESKINIFKFLEIEWILCPYRERKKKKSDQMVKDPPPEIKQV